MTQNRKKRDFTQLFKDVAHLKKHACCVDHAGGGGGGVYRLTPIVANTFTLTEDGTAVSSIDLTTYVNRARVDTMALALGTLTLTRDDATTLTADLSALDRARVNTMAIALDVLTLTRDDATTLTADLTPYVNRARIDTIALAPATNILTLTRDDATTITSDLSGLVNTTIYTGDATIAGDRTVSGAGYTRSIDFDSISNFNVYANNIELDSSNNPTGAVFLSAGGVAVLESYNASVAINAATTIAQTSAGNFTATSTAGEVGLTAFGKGRFTSGDTLALTSTGANVEVITSAEFALVVPEDADPDTNVLTPLNGMIKYDSTDDEFRFREAGAWRTFSVAGGGATKYTADIALTAGATVTVTHSLGTTDILDSLKNPAGAKVYGYTLNNYTANTVDITVTVSGTYRIILL